MDAIWVQQYRFFRMKHITVQYLPNYPDCLKLKHRLGHTKKEYLTVHYFGISRHHIWQHIRFYIKHISRSSSSMWLIRSKLYLIWKLLACRLWIYMFWINSIMLRHSIGHNITKHDVGLFYWTQCNKAMTMRHYIGHNVTKPWHCVILLDIM